MASPEIEAFPDGNLTQYILFLPTNARSRHGVQGYLGLTRNYCVVGTKTIPDYKSLEGDLLNIPEYPCHIDPSLPASPSNSKHKYSLTKDSTSTQDHKIPYIDLTNA